MALSGLLLCMIVLCAINSQNSAFAKSSSSIKPDLKLFFNDAIFPNSYPSNDFANTDRSHSSEVGSDTQGSTKAEDETTTAPQVDEKSAAEEEIDATMGKTNEELFESGIFGLEVGK